MNKRPGHVDVQTEVGYCSFCARTRNLRREAHRLGELVRVIVTCETCHRTLSNSIGVAATEPEAEPASAPAPAEKPPSVTKAAVPGEATTRQTPGKRPTKAAAAKAKTPPKPRSTATRRISTKKK